LQRKKKMFLSRLFTLLISAILFVNCSDLRTKTVKRDFNEMKGRQLLVEMGKAHGIENWQKISTYSVDFEEEFFGKLGERSSPYPETKTKLRLDYVPNTFNGRMTQKSGKISGIQSWKTYHFSSNDDVVFEKDEDAYFWLPTYQYFIEFPLRIQNANAIAYAGEKEIDGVICDGILASWNKTKPQRKIDQYLIWIKRDTKQIFKLEYTIREVFTFIKGAAYFKDYKSYDGLLLPSSFPVESNLVKEGLLHEMRILNFERNQLDKEILEPLNDNSSIDGDKKP